MFLEKQQKDLQDFIIQNCDPSLAENAKILEDKNKINKHLIDPTKPNYFVWSKSTNSASSKKIVVYKLSKETELIELS